MQNLNKRLFIWLDKISYKTRRKKQIEEYDKKMNYYLQMENAEFMVEYIDISTRYSNNKATFNISWFTGIILILITMYKYIISIGRGIRNTNLSELEMQVVINANGWMAIIVILVAAVILYAISSSRSKITKEKIFVDEMKAIRMGKTINEDN